MVKAMQEHVSSEGVQEEGCLALWNLAAYSADNTVAIAAKGGMEAVAKAMQEHVSSAGVQEQMCRALGNLAVNADNKVAEPRQASRSRGAGRSGTLRSTPTTRWRRSSPAESHWWVLASRSRL